MIHLLNDELSLRQGLIPALRHICNNVDLYRITLYSLAYVVDSGVSTNQWDKKWKQSPRLVTNNNFVFASSSLYSINNSHFKCVWSHRVAIGYFNYVISAIQSNGISDDQQNGIADIYQSQKPTGRPSPLWRQWCHMFGLVYIGENLRRWLSSR